mgnify:FL=1
MTALCRCGGSGREVIHHPSGNGAEVRRCRGCGGTGIPYPAWAPTSLRGVALEDSTPQPDGTHLVTVRLDAPSRVPADVSGGPFVGSNPTERAIAATLNNLRLGDRVAPSPEARVCPACFGRTVVAHFSYRREAGELVKCQRCCGTGLRSHEDIADALGIPWPSEGDDLAHAPPPVDLAAENAALRAALDASGELLAEAHAELERLRGER